MLVAQLDRVFGYEPKGRGFESLQARQKASALADAFFMFAEIKRESNPEGEPSLSAAGGGNSEGAGLCSGRQKARQFIAEDR